MSNAEQMEQTTEDPTSLLALGRKYLATKSYPEAVESLACACEGLAELHGEAADQCADAYYYYGKALLALSREESGVLGDGVPGSNADAPDEEDDDDDDEDGEETNETANGKCEAEAKTNGDAQTSAQAKTTASEDPVSTTSKSKPGSDFKPSVADSKPDSSEAKSVESQSKPDTTEVAGSSEEPGPSNGEANGDESVAELENEDDVDNLQLAWEMLDLARSIYEKRVESGGGDVARERLAEVHLVLGEVALESETYDKAVVDMQSCLEIQKTLYSSDDRRIAETHYHIGLANSLASNFEDAIIHFKNAANILQTRIKKLENPELAAEDAFVKKYKVVDPGYSVENEIKELEELLPEIKEKIQDMMDYKAETLKRVRESLFPSNGDGAASSSAAGSSTSDKPKPAASDISHLIKRKRKSSENDTEASAAKKPST